MARGLAVNWPCGHSAFCLLFGDTVKIYIRGGYLDLSNGLKVTPDSMTDQIESEVGFVTQKISLWFE